MRKIPEEHKHLPEAKCLAAAQAAFTAAAEALVAANRAARADGKNVTEELFAKAKALEPAQQELKAAEAEFDRATGEPKPVAVTGIVLDKVRETYAPELQEEAICTLATGLTLRLPLTETLEGLDRVRLAVLKLAAGNLAELRRQVEVAKVDWRDVINPAEYPEATSMSILDYKNLDEKSKHDITTRDRQQYVAWLGKSNKS